MRKTPVMILAALGATCLLPMSSAFAADDMSSTTSAATESTSTTESAPTGSVMDAAQFRDGLNRLRSLFQQMRENRSLAMAASNDMLSQSQLQEINRSLMVRALGELDQISRQWRTTDLPSGAMASGSTEMNRYGSASAVRYANESDDTAWVRNTVWQLQEKLLADKLNGRGPVITSQMRAMLDSAIHRAENPSFRVARALDTDLLRQRTERTESETTTTQVTPPASEATPAPETAPAPETPAPPTVSETPQETTPAPTTEEQSTTTTEENTTESSAPATSSETTQEETQESRMGSANLPQTGGDPSMLFLLGSGVGAFGLVLRKRN